MFEASYESSPAEAFGNLRSSPAYFSPPSKAGPSSMNFHFGMLVRHRLHRRLLSLPAALLPLVRRQLSVAQAQFRGEA